VTGHRVFAIAVVALVACGLGGCAGGFKVVENADDIREGDHVSVAGTVSMRGSTPFSTVVLELPAGGVVSVYSENDDIMAELRGLAGLQCQVEGLAGAPLSGTPRLEATGYQLLPLPSGELPIVGVLSMEDGQYLLETAKKKRYWIRGDLAGAVAEYVGARVWIVGIKTDTDAPGRPDKTTPFTVTGYGLIDEAAAR
jgi:hypothetical protein